MTDTIDAMLAKLEAEEAALTTRLGGSAQTKKLMEARDRVERLRALAGTQPLTIADLRGMTQKQVAALDPAVVDAALAEAAAPVNVDDPASLTTADLRRMTPQQVRALQDSHPKVMAKLLGQVERMTVQEIMAVPQEDWSQIPAEQLPEGWLDRS